MGKHISDFLRLHLFKGDIALWMVYFLLCVVSVVEIYSASSNLTFQGGHHWDPVVDQVEFLFYGFLVILLVSRIPCKYFRLLSTLGILLSIVLLVWVLTKEETNEASRWLTVPVVGISFQPSEVAKPCLLLFVAGQLTKINQARRKLTTRIGRAKAAKAMRQGYWTIMVVSAVVCGLIAPENLSTALMIALVVFVMMYVGNVSGKYLLRTIGAALLLVSLFVGWVAVTPDEELSGHARVLTWKHRVEEKLGVQQSSLDEADSANQYVITDKKRQEFTAHIAIANSNIIGRGAGNSVGRDFLPHAESDFIYAIIVEELGILGAFFVMMFYVWLFVLVWRIARRSDRFFAAYLSIGLALMLVVQALVNMAVAVGLAPVTGQTLPLISHGGTSILITSFCIGMILSVSRYVERVSATKDQPAEAIPACETNEYAVAGSMQ